MQAVLFRLAGQGYALPVETVREVVPYRRPRALPKVDPWELGLVSLRGELVHVWDLAARLGLDAAGPPEGPLVVATIEPAVAFAVEEILGVREVEAARFSELDGELVELLDAATLFSTEQPDDGLDALPLAELRRLAGEAQIPGRWQMGRERLVAALRDARSA